MVRAYEAEEIRNEGMTEDAKKVLFGQTANVVKTYRERRLLRINFAMPGGSQDRV